MAMSIAMGAVSFVLALGIILPQSSNELVLNVREGFRPLQSPLIIAGYLSLSSMLRSYFTHEAEVEWALDFDVYRVLVALLAGILSSVGFVSARTWVLISFSTVPDKYRLKFTMLRVG